MPKEKVPSAEELHGRLADFAVRGVLYEAASFLGRHRDASHKRDQVRALLIQKAIFLEEDPLLVKFKNASFRELRAKAPSEHASIMGILRRAYQRGFTH